MAKEIKAQEAIAEADVETGGEFIPEPGMEEIAVAPVERPRSSKAIDQQSPESRNIILSPNASPKGSPHSGASPKSSSPRSRGGSPRSKGGSPIGPPSRCKINS